MKKYFTLIAALGFSMMAYAQMPDASKWQVGQDVSADLNWGDYTGVWSTGGYKKEESSVTATPNASPYWLGDQPNEMAPDEATTPGTYPMMGFYNDGAVGEHLIDMYQVFQLPAGIYRFVFNAVYREGTPADTWASYQAKNPKKNAHGYVTTLESSDPEGEIIRDFDKVIQSLPYSTIHERLFEDSSNSWKTDGSYCIGTGGTPADTIFYPNCDEGAALHFAQDNYHHELKFILLDDGYVRVGLRKTANIAQDWFGWSRMKIIYDGPANEQAQIDIAMNDLNEVVAKYDDLKDRAGSAGFIGLASLMEDQEMEYLGNLDEGDIVSILATTSSFELALDKYNAAYTSANSLAELISSSEDIYASTSFEGKATFGLTIEAAKIVAYAEVIDNIKDYSKAFTSLSGARATYLNSQEVGSLGEKDFTSLIKHPWFVNPENTPVLIDNRRGDGYKVWVITENGEPSDAWNEQNVASGQTGVNNVINPSKGRENIVSKVTLSGDVDVTNQWFKYVNWKGWSPGLSLCYHGGLIGPSDGWNSISGGSSEIRQQIVGLPEGYYSLKGLMRGNQAGATWDKKTHNIFAQNSKGDIVKSPVGDTDGNLTKGWTQWGWNEWNGRAWAEHKTSIIGAPDGELLIGAQTSMVMIATGFRLFFYGTEPPFDTMIQEDIDNVQNQLNLKALWLGDKKFVQDKLDKIAGLRPIASTAAYDQAMAYAKEATDYMRVAEGAISSFSAIDDYTSLQLNYDENSEQYKMIQPALTFVTNLEAGENSTYTDAEAAGKVYDAYESYITMYDKAAAVTTSTVYPPILAKHATDIKAGYKDVETLNAYEKELAKLYSQEVIKALGGDLASKENPIDVTILLNNPNFNGTGGWSGTSISQNEYGNGRHTAEIWNQTTFNTYQVVTGMPNGVYQLTAHALYRDGNGSADLQKCYETWIGCGKDKQAWENHNAVIYLKTDSANVAQEYITSVCDTKESGISFPGYFKITDAEYTVGNNGTFLLYEELTEEDKASFTDAETGEIFYQNAYDYTGSQFQYPFDGRIYPDAADSTKVAFFPESMAGAALRFAHGEYKLGTELTVFKTGEDLTLGLQKFAGFSGDWVIFSNFQLYYLGIPTGIEAVKTTNANSNVLYNIAGQAVDNSFKGIVIKNGKKVLNK